MLGGQERKRGGGMHGEGRAEGEHQIGFPGGLLGPLQFSWVEPLAKADRGELQVAAADALGSPPALAEKLEVRGPGRRAFHNSGTRPAYSCHGVLPDAPARCRPEREARRHFA